MKKCKLLLFDLDGTLLQSDKTISTRTLSALKKCRGNDILIGVSTSRSEQNSLVFLNELMHSLSIWMVNGRGLISSHRSSLGRLYQSFNMEQRMPLPRRK